VRPTVRPPPPGVAVDEGEDEGSSRDSSMRTPKWRDNVTRLTAETS